MSNGITRENLDTLIEEIIGVCNCDWMTDESKPAVIERILVDNGLVSVIEEPEEKVDMSSIFRIEVNTEVGGYGCTESLKEVLTDVEVDFGETEAKEVLLWARSSEEGDEYISENKKLYIRNIGKE